MTLAQEINKAYTGTVNIYTSPLPGAAPMQLQVAAGTQITDLLPHHRLPWVCIANGLPLRREYWLKRAVMPGDVVDMHAIVAGGGGGSRSILGAIAAIALSAFAPYLAGTVLGFTGATATLVAAGITLAGTALINALIMPKANTSTNQYQQASPTYDVALSGNQARLNSPIPVCYGRMRSFPDYASQPYTEYSTESAPEGDQYFYGLYAIGHGHFDIGAVTIGDSDIKSFTDVEYKILPPGTQPSLVKASVVTAVEVNGQVLTDDIPTGPFVACGPGRRLKGLGIDIVCPRGLAKVNLSTGKTSAASVEIEVSYREINDAYAPLGDWITLPLQKITAGSLTAQRRSFYFEFDAPVRIAVRVRRTTKQSDSTELYDECNWYAMRGYLVNTATLAPTVTHMEVRIKASEQMSGASQRKVGVIWQRKLRTWSPEEGFSAEPVVTRNPMWALVDKWMDTVYGDRMPAERIDLQSIHAIAMLCDERKDRFDYIFDSRTTSFDADKLIGAVCRTTPIRRNGKRSAIRDEYEDTPITAFTSRNITRDSSSFQYLQHTDQSADGLIVQYFDRNAFDWLEVECPAPGRNYTSPDDPRWKPGGEPPMENPVVLQMPGITGPTQAEREGLYQAASNALRRKYATWSTEMNATLVYFGAPVLFAPILHNAAQAGDCAFWNASKRNLSLTEPPTLGPNSAIVLERPDGSVTKPIAVTPGEDEFSVVLAEEPDFSLRLSDSRSERTKYVLYDGEEFRHLAKMLAIRPRGKDGEGVALFEMYAVIDDEAVHTADAHLLTGEGDDPDAFENWPDEEGGTETPPAGTVTLSGLNFTSIQFVKPKLTFQSDGLLRIQRVNPTLGPEDTIIAGQWTVDSPQPNPDIGKAYEIQVRGQVQSVGDGQFAGPWFTDIPYTDSGLWRTSPWMPLSENVVLELEGDPFNGRVQIRDAADPFTIQASTTLFMQTLGYGGGDGG